MSKLLNDLNWFYSCIAKFNHDEAKTVTSEDLQDIILVDEILYDLDDYCECFEKGFTNDLSNRLRKVGA